MQAIRELGPDASLIEIASGAGVSKPALYSEFGDKEGLVDAIAQVSGDRIDAAIVAGLEARGALGERDICDLMVESAINFADNDPHVFSLVLRGLRNQERPYANNPIRIRIHGRAMALVTMIAEDANDAERELITSAFVGMLLTAVETWQQTRTLPKERVIEIISASIYAGLRELTAQAGQRS